MRTARVALAAATLFFLELHTGQRLAPLLGGGAVVWLSTVVGFQILLLLAYAGVLAPVPTRAHVGAVITALAIGVVGGTSSVIGVVSMGLALPSFLPALLRRDDTAPLLLRGRWIAASNLGALGGLLVYAVIEPQVGLAAAETCVRAAGALLALALAFDLRTDRVAVAGREQMAYRPQAQALAAAAVGVLWYLSLHARIEATLPASPQLWATTLGLYLLGFALPFVTPDARVRRTVSLVAAPVALLAVIALERDVVPSPDLAGLLALFLGCLAAHNSLRDRFDAERPWTHGALDAALGGAIAGTITLVVLPLVSSTAQQLALAGVLLVVLLARPAPRRIWRPALLVLAVAQALTILAWPQRDGISLRTVRSWYGEFTVRELDLDSPLHHHRALYHQRTVHGAQYLDPRLLDLPTAYYSIYSGAGITLRALQSARGEAAALRIGVIGLGTGAVATYADHDDLVRFFEIDARNLGLVQGEGALFTFADLSRGRVEYVVGDGRLALEREREADDALYDVLVLDAFSGGNVPTHLLTHEAFLMYRERLRPDGLLLVHTSNHVLDLRPVVYDAARSLSWRAVFVRNRPRPYTDHVSRHEHLVMRADWIVMGPPTAPWSAMDALLARHVTDGDVVVQRAEDVRFEGIDGWTDDRRSVWPLRQARVSARERLVSR